MARVTGGAAQGKATAPTSTEMRSAFESMMGSLLGMLSAGQQMTVIPLAAKGAPGSGEVAGLGQLADNPTAENLAARVNAKMGQAGQINQTPASGLETDVSSLLAAAPDGQPESQALTEDQPMELPSTPIAPTIAGQAAGADQTAALGTAMQQAMAEMNSDGGDEPEQTLPTPTATPATSNTNSMAAALGLATQNSVAPASSVTPASSRVPVVATPVEQIGEQVQLSLGRGENDATIQLNPKELGAVRIRLQMENGQLRLSIRAEQPETGRLLNSRLADLRQSLEGQGIKVGELAVARSERATATEAAAREVAPTIRSGQMDMNSNGSQAQRQPAAFAGGNFGEGGFGRGQNTQRQTGEQGIGGEPLLSAVEGRTSRSPARGPAGVDYYA